MTSDDTYLSLPTASQILRDSGLKVSTAMLRRWARKGQIATTRLPNGRAQISRGELDAIARGERAA